MITITQNIEEKKFVAKRNEEKIGEIFYGFGYNSNLIVYQSWFLAGEDEIKIGKTFNR